MLIWKKNSPYPAPVSTNSCYSPAEEEVSSEPNTIKRHRRTKAEMEEARSLAENQAKTRNKK